MDDVGELEVRGHKDVVEQVGGLEVNAEGRLEAEEVVFKRFGNGVGNAGPDLLDSFIDEEEAGVGDAVGPDLLEHGVGVDNAVGPHLLEYEVGVDNAVSPNLLEHGKLEASTPPDDS